MPTGSIQPVLLSKQLSMSTGTASVPPHPSSQSTPTSQPAKSPKSSRKTKNMHLARSLKTSCQSHQRAYQAKIKAVKDLNGSSEEEFAELPEYYEKLREATPGSLITLETTDEGHGAQFKRLFIAYEASVMHCRLILSLDGTQIWSKYGGILLAATAVDQLFPFALAIVSTEKMRTGSASASIFIARSKLIPMRILTALMTSLFSDCQKGLFQGVGTWFPGSAHAYCMRHLEKNFKAKFKHKELTMLLWKAARATKYHKDVPNDVSVFPGTTSLFRTE